ncbi:hypothetical protein [Campylobacter sputorum]|nr:hypothetical protein [Campylobacter sp. RM13538]MBF6675182.1 hypothetical protein [Campylobacter sp. RM13538]
MLHELKDIALIYKLKSIFNKQLNSIKISKYRYLNLDTGKNNLKYGFDD